MEPRAFTTRLKRAFGTENSGAAKVRLNTFLLVRSDRKVGDGL